MIDLNPAPILKVGEVAQALLALPQCLLDALAQRKFIFNMNLFEKK